MNSRTARGGRFRIEAVCFAVLFLCRSVPMASAAQPAQWFSRGPGGGGAFFAPSFSPYRPGEMYLTTDMSDVYHSTNYGASWSVIDFRQIEGNRQAIVQFTGDPKVRYDIDYSNNAQTPTRSVDGGATWRQLAGDPTGGGAFALFADPAATNRVLVSDYTTIYFSTDGGATFNSKYANANGLYLAGAFFDGTNVYVATGDGMVVSADNGNSFALAALGGINGANETMFSFAGAKQNGTTRFFCTTLHPADVFPGLTIESVYGSYISVYALDWGHANWWAVTNGINAEDDPVFVAMAQNDISTAYIAGQQNNNYEYPALYKTVNGGTNWQLSLLVTNNQNVFTGWAGNHGDSDWGYGAGALGLAVAPNDSTRVIYSDLGFAHLSTNGGAFWKQVYVNPADENPTNAPTPRGRSYHGVGLENTSCWGLTWADSNHLVASFTDIKATISADAGNSWSFGYTGDSYNTMYRCIQNPITGVLYAGVSSIHDMYQSTRLVDTIINPGTGAILFSTNQGVTWQTMYNAAHPVIWLATDPNRTNFLYASIIHSNLGGIFVSTNIQNGAASTWTKLTNPPRTLGHPFNLQVLNDGTLLCSYSATRGGSPQAFIASSGVFISTNSGASWLDRTGPNMTYWTMDVVVDPNDAAQNTWYAGVYSGYGGHGNNLGGLYGTTNRGVSWTRLNDMGGGGVSSCTFNPLNGNELYVTTETAGLLICTNINAAIPAFTADPNYPFMQPERVFFNPYKPTEVWVTSFGNGMRVGSTAAVASLPGTLQLTAPQGGTAALSLGQATPGANYAIQESTDFTNWTPIGTNAAGGNGMVQFTDAHATNAQRFYRSLAQ